MYGVQQHARRHRVRFSWGSGSGCDPGGGNASNKARFEDGLEEEAAEIGVAAGKAKAYEIAQRRARGL